MKNNKKYQEAFLSMTKHRSIFLNENFDKEMSAVLTALLIYFDSKSNDPIKIYINSNGGDLSAMYQVYDTMQMVKSPISTICMGKAYSAGAVILSAGSKGLRHCMRNANIMIHGVQLVFPTMQDNDSENAESYLKFVDSLNNGMLKILSKHTGQAFDKVKQDCSRDLFLDPQKAIEYGIIDSII